MQISMLVRFCFFLLLAPCASPRALASAKDTTPPSLSFSPPQQVRKLTYFPSLYGWVKDNEGGSGIARVTVRLELSTKGKVYYWDGYQWGKQPVASTPADVFGKRWRYNENNLPTRYYFSNGMGTPPVLSQLVSGLHRFTVTAYDHAGNSKSIAFSLRVNADEIRPAVGFSWPSSGAVVHSLSLIRGWARDKGGSGLSCVKLRLLREIDKTSRENWTGTKWTPGWYPGPPPLVPAVLINGRWQITAGLPKGANLPDGRYILSVFAYDHAGNCSDEDMPKGIGVEPVKEILTITRVRVRHSR